MSSRYTWSHESSGPAWRAARPDHFGWWVLLAVLLAVLLHAGILWGMAKLGIKFEMADAMEWKSRAFNVEQVEVIPESSPIEPEEEEVPVPPEDVSTLLTEIEELLPELDNIEIDVSPDIAEPEVAIQMEQPALAGDEAGQLLEPVRAPEVSSRLEEVGTNETLFQEVPEGRVVIEEGTVQSDVPDPDEFLKDAAKKGAGGLSDKGLLEGYTGLGKLLTLPVGELNRSRAALPSDLLFDYDSAELKEGARLGLMKLAVLIDRNPKMFCILEGHSDLFGTEEYNLDLSRQRAEAVKYWLVRSLRLDGERIIVRGYGKTKPKVLEGSIEEQAINRRVDILMRKEIPPEEPVLVKPKRALPVEPETGRAVPIDERAIPVDEKAVPVEEDPPAADETPGPLKAKPVEPLRAEPVE